MAVYIPMTQVTVNSVDISDRVISCVLSHSKESQDVTTQADTARKYAGGLESNTVTLEVQLDGAAGSTTATLSSLVGTTTTVVLIPTAAAVSSTNKRYTLADTFMESFSPVDGSLGAIATTSVTFSGGTLTEASS